MNLGKLVDALDTFFDGAIAGLKDASLNGLQVGDRNWDVKKIAFAVDASLATIEQAREQDVDLLIVHHGISWGREQAIVGTHLTRVTTLIEHKIALYAAHLPLDAEPRLGNNVAIARRIGLQIDLAPDYRAGRIHVLGHFDTPRRIDEILTAMELDHPAAYRYLPFGPKEIRKVLVCSGEGGFLLDEAIAAGADLLLTGELLHKFYHPALEAGISYLAAGHYETESYGVRELKAYIDRGALIRDIDGEGIETIFIEHPTGL